MHLRAYKIQLRQQLLANTEVIANLGKEQPIAHFYLSDFVKVHMLFEKNQCIHENAVSGAHCGLDSDIVNGVCYREILNDFFFKQINDFSLNDTWFEPDRITCIAVIFFVQGKFLCF